MKTKDDFYLEAANHFNVTVHYLDEGDSIRVRDYAMNEFARQEAKREAIEFAKWVVRNDFSCTLESKCSRDQTADELYTIFNNRYKNK